MHLLDDDLAAIPHQPEVLIKQFSIPKINKNLGKPYRLFYRHRQFSYRGCEKGLNDLTMEAIVNLHTSDGVFLFQYESFIKKNL